jgi:hypothetical protein
LNTIAVLHIIAKQVLHIIAKTNCMHCNANTGPHICRLYIVGFENHFKFVANISNKLYFYNGQMDKVYLYSMHILYYAKMHCLTILNGNIHCINKRFTYPIAASLGHSLHILPRFSDSSPSIRSQLIEVRLDRAMISIFSLIF